MCLKCLRATAGRLDASGFMLFVSLKDLRTEFEEPFDLS